MYPGSNNGATETYMMPGTGPNPQVTLVSPPAGFECMANEVAPEVIYDQGLFYPAANYYGYYCTGLEPQSEWNDHHRFFGVDGQEIHYSGVQTETYPYVYYSPSYGYAQSSYNPYNPYIPGAMMGPDSPVIGSEQYFSNPSYQLPVSSPTTYFPMVVQPSSDAVPNSFVAPSLYSGTDTSAPSRQTGVGSKHSQAHFSSNRGTTFQGAASRISNFESSLPASSEVPANVSSSKQSSSLITPGSVTHMTQGIDSSGLMQATDHFSHGNVPSIQIPTNVASHNLLPNHGNGVHGWATVDRLRPRFQVNGAGKNGSVSHDILGEQNRGPRTNKSKGQWTSAISAQLGRAGGEIDHEAIVISADQYNKDDFPVDYTYAKFFVIKSYSEDDVHKSIKYSVWSSTTNGNKRLNAAYEDAHRMSAGTPRNCPVFLFFSVNASGQFCGVAEMIGPVDFHKDMDFWQQDKWTGSFPVKWHIIKDVPNTSFRHIVLENNENKPVTNSRDTQEITYVPGMNMLNIFKSSPLKTSILDDFMFYEERQKIIQEEKSRFTGRSNAYVPAVVSASKPIDSDEQNEESDNPSKDNEVQSNVNVDPSPRADGNVNVDPSPRADGKQDADTVKEAIQSNLKQQKSSGSGPLDIPKSNSIELSNDKKDVKSNQMGDVDDSTSIIKMKSLSIGSKEESTEDIVAKASTETDVVTVGSVNIKVNGTVEPSSSIK